ncbi:MAG: GDP-mannose 4,6-dehydratase [Verrucomicrobiota bacterium]
MHRALITGITGQDGSYLAELLLAKGYEVHGIVRRSNRPESSWIGHLCRDATILGKRLLIHYADLDDPGAVRRVLQKSRPSELYHLAGPSQVGWSFEMPEATCQATGMLTLRFLEMVRDMEVRPKFLYASSCEIYGEPLQAPQDETTPLAPVTPYGCGKALATQLVRVYRKAHGLFASNAILFNHESPRRGEGFVTRKITRAAAAIKLGLQQELQLGNLSGERDWGHARDYVEGMWRSLQHPAAEDFVFATGASHSVQQCVESAFEAVEMDWRKYVRHDPQLLRPAEPKRLLGNAAKAKELLAWQPQSTFAELIREMTQADLEALSKRSE